MGEFSAKGLAAVGGGSSSSSSSVQNIGPLGPFGEMKSRGKAAGDLGDLLRIKPDSSAFCCFLDLDPRKSKERKEEGCFL